MTLHCLQRIQSGLPPGFDHESSVRIQLKSIRTAKPTPIRKPLKVKKIICLDDVLTGSGLERIGAGVANKLGPLADPGTEQM